MVQLYIVKPSDMVAVLYLVSDNCASLEGSVKLKAAFRASDGRL